ncbi:hypothetical protein RhiXN_05357 [Rhizoctonia solani]|uniref:Uncharacterized protein n=1 Tax=Rhizoctonia solani TaxID=456999 RepID=A0A8H8NRM9_9AGAM|nr:uncharacterized protein RhiXN_05357 [Rhizoctonia solani]QRW17355.1 hypothetical protein RhiXN_05357 [Rhizoctonia solani]
MPGQPKSLVNDRFEDEGDVSIEYGAKWQRLQRLIMYGILQMHPTMFDALENTARTVGSRKEADVGMQRYRSSPLGTFSSCLLDLRMLRLQTTPSAILYGVPLFPANWMEISQGTLANQVRTCGHAGSAANRKAACKGQEVYRLAGWSYTDQVRGIVLSSSAGESVDPDRPQTLSGNLVCSKARDKADVAEGTNVSRVNCRSWLKAYVTGSL